MRGQIRICMRISTISSFVLTDALDAAQLGRIMTPTVHLLPVKQAVKPQRLTAGGAGGQSGGKHLDPPRREALDVQEVQAFPEPVDEQVAGIGSMCPDHPCVALLDRGGVQDHCEDSLGSIGEGLLQGRGLCADSLAAGRLEIRVAQAGPLPRSP
jgi:hypothetical protein